MKRMVKRLAAGWAKPADAVRWHFFPRERTLSACRAYVQAGPRKVKGDPARELCPVCVRDMASTRPDA